MNTFTTETTQIFAPSASFKIPMFPDVSCFQKTSIVGSTRFSKLPVEAFRLIHGLTGAQPERSPRSWHMGPPPLPFRINVWQFNLRSLKMVLCIYIYTQYIYMYIYIYTYIYNMYIYIWYQQIHDRLILFNPCFHPFSSCFFTTSPYFFEVPEAVRQGAPFWLAAIACEVGPIPWPLPVKSEV